MELLEGESLASRIRRAGQLPLGQIGDIGRQISSVLAATHAAGITHRDLKPDNVFLIEDGDLASGERVKVLDFGIAKLGVTTGLTARAGAVMMGTPGYMAPEQWDDAGRVDGRADVYALGCIVFKMCCGRLPFEASSIPEAYVQHLKESPPRARSLAPHIPAELDGEQIVLTEVASIEPQQQADQLAGFLSVTWPLPLARAIRSLADAGIAGKFVVGATEITIGKMPPGATVVEQLLSSQDGAKIVAAEPLAHAVMPVPFLIGGIGAAVIGLLVLVISLTIGRNGGATFSVAREMRPSR